MEMNTGVFTRTLEDSSGKEIGDGLYNLTIGSVLCWGFAVNWFMVNNIPYELIAQINPILFFIGYFVCCMGGVFLFKSSDNPLISFLGYNLVVIPFGFVINLVVAGYDPVIVSEAIRITGIVTGLMMFLGTLFPRFFQRIAGALSIALFIVIIVEAIEVFVFKRHHGIFDWIVVLIFCGYIGYDWARANNIPKTLDNAIDSAAALYMDIVILFLRVLSILGRRK